jgi:5'(3')-deoxyribonucleotidase
MDDVIADFYKAAAHPIDGNVLEEKMFDPFFFLRLDPVPGAKSGVFQLVKMGFDVWILSQPFALLPESYMEKVQWVQLHFPQLSNKIILTQDKGLNLGHYLIDDNKKKWQEKFEQNGGKFVHFPYGGYNLPNFGDPEGTWDYIVEYFKKENPYLD